MATITGTASANSLTGTALADTIFGMGGNDTLSGRGGNDVLNGGLGNDNMSGGYGDDVFYVDSLSDIVREYSGQGTDTVRTTVSYTLAVNVENGILEGTGAINLTGNSGANVLTGNAGANLLSGGGGNDTLSGGSGADTLTGGTGNDRLSGGIGNDTFLFKLGDRQDVITDFAAGDLVKISGYAAAQSIAQVGTSVVVTLSASDKITFSNASLATVSAALQFGTGTSGGGGTGTTKTGTNGNDVLNGTTANDTIYGLGGDDTLNGGGGDDRIIGGAGWDVMTGGAGSDTFAFLTRSDSPLMTTIYSDFITDWSSLDRIDLSGIDANETIAGNQAFAFGGYSFGTPPSVTTPGTFTIAGFGGEIYVIGFTDTVAGPDFQIAIWSVLGESGVTVDQFIF